MSARRSGATAATVAALLIFALALWAAHHVVSLMTAAHGGRGFGLALVFAGTFAMLTWQTVLGTIERTYRVTPRQQGQLDRLNVVVAVPAYNEDEQLLVLSLHSLLTQTRLPNHVCVVDDGSKVSYSRAKEWFFSAAAEAGVRASWLRTPNRGKRQAQGAVVSATPDADIYLTVDSDAILSPTALDEGLKPFTDPKVMSVAGVVVASNVKRSFLCRFTDLWFVTSQLVDRSSASAMGSVLVNSGPLALYRAHVVRDNLASYLSETFAGRRVEFSDDSMLTMYALLAGKTVQQPTAVVFSAMPETLSHHTRQFLRWMRGSSIRSLWRLRYLPVVSYAYWSHLARWASWALATAMIVAIWVVQPFSGHVPSLWLAAIPFAIGYGHGLRYLTIRRSDQSMAYQIGTWALMPVAVLWSATVLRALRWYGIATMLRTGWGTRAEVEVSA